MMRYKIYLISCVFKQKPIGIDYIFSYLHIDYTDKLHFKLSTINYISSYIEYISIYLHFDHISSDLDIDYISNYLKTNCSSCEAQITFPIINAQFIYKLITF